VFPKTTLFILLARSTGARLIATNLALGSFPQETLLVGLLSERFSESDQLLGAHVQVLGDLLRVASLQNLLYGIHYLFVGFFLGFCVAHDATPKALQG
jgi:hypothetical protein